MNEHENVMSDALITKEELADRVRRAPRTVLRWVREKRIPVVYVGRSVFFDWVHVRRALSRPECPSQFPNGTTPLDQQKPKRRKTDI